MRYAEEDYDEVPCRTCGQTLSVVLLEGDEGGLECNACRFAGMSSAQIEHALYGPDAPSEAEAMEAFARTGDLPF